MAGKGQKTESPGVFNAPGLFVLCAGGRQRIALHSIITNKNLRSPHK
jgi:hypothetical protein